MNIRHFPPDPLPQRRPAHHRGPRDRRFYDPSQPRDWHGRWSGGGGSASAQGHVAKNIDRRMDEIIKGGKHVGESEECVALVKHLNPGIGPAKDWEEGPKIKGPGDPPLERGTALATFKNGRYQNRASGNHCGHFPGVWGKRRQVGNVGAGPVSQQERTASPALQEIPGGGGILLRYHTPKVSVA